MLECRFDLTERDLGVPAAPSGFPLYLCSLPPAPKFPYPNPVPAPKSRPRSKIPAPKGCRSNP